MSQAASSPRYAVGIDLGTSHTVVASAPLVPDGLPQLSLLPIAQRLSAAEVQAQVLLPSVCYLGAADELGQAWLQPWPPLGATPEAPATLGMWARTLGASQPQRLVASSKSWLSHPGVDRTAAILPWGAPAEVPKISPLAASAATLAHVRAAWDATHPDAPLAQQQLVLTVPASFDEGARALTLQAATLAGIFSLTEEEARWLQVVPYKGSLPTAVPTDPLIYRWYEIVSVYGTTIKELIHEEFGDGIMSAIDFSMDIQREANPNGDRVNVVLSGKFLPYKQY